MIGDHSASAGALPAELTSFIGRRSEISEIKSLMADWRLVTIYGPGGVGKSRLAVHLANAVARSFADGVFFVDLTPVTALQHAIDAFATALGVEQRDIDSILRRIGSKRMLVIMDNCEQAIDASAELASAIIETCPNARLLATSRESLEVEGETTFSIAPLSLAAEGDGHSLAADLFIARATAVHPGFDARNDLETIGEICFRLDGLPLAIELAAARLRMLSPADILRHLSEPFRLLTGGRRTLPERQRTLRSSVEWSYDLCSDDERMLWKYLSVFIGGFDITAAEAVTAAIGGSADALSAVRALIDKSVITRAAGQTHTRYSMLASIRELGLEHAASDGDLAGANGVLCDWCIAFVASAERDWYTQRQVDWLDRYDSEIPNMRAALEYSLGEGGDAFDVFDLTTPLWRAFWVNHGRVAELDEWLSRAFAVTSGPRGLRKRGLVLHGFIIGSRDGVDTARKTLEEARRLSINTHDELTVKSVEAAYAMLLPDSAEAARMLEDWYAFGRTLPTMLARTGAHMWLALLQDRLGNTERANELQRAILERGAQTGEIFESAELLFGMGVNALGRGDAERASLLSRESIGLRAELAPTAQTAHSVETIAAAAVVEGNAERAATCFGIADTIWVMTGASRNTVGPATVDRDIYEKRAREALPAELFEREYQAGRARSARQGIAWLVDRGAPLAVAGVAPVAPQRARGEGGGVGARSVAVAGSPGLTKREIEVAQLVASGRSNKEIAAALVVAQRTAEGHVQRILTKLGLTSRVQLAGWVRDHDI